MKVCNTCGLPGKKFGPDKRNKDGLQGRCNDCRSASRKGKHKYYPEIQKPYALKRALKEIREISDNYVIAELKRGTGLTSDHIKKYPELIEAKRQIIKNKRLLKNEQRKRTS